MNLPIDHACITHKVLIWTKLDRIALLSNVRDRFAMVSIEELAIPSLIHEGDIFSQVDLFAILQFYPFCWYKWFDHWITFTRVSNYPRIRIFANNSQK